MRDRNMGEVARKVAERPAKRDATIKHKPFHTILPPPTPRNAGYGDGSKKRCLLAFKLI